MIYVLIDLDQEKKFFECDGNVTVRSVLKAYTSLKQLDYEHFYGLNNGENIAVNKIKRLKLKDKLDQEEKKIKIIQINAGICEEDDFERTASNVTTKSMLEEADEKDYEKIKEITNPKKIKKLNKILSNPTYENDSDDEEESEVNDESQSLDILLYSINDLNLNIDPEYKGEDLIPPDKDQNRPKDDSYKNYFKLYSLLFIEYFFIFLVRLLGAVFGINTIFNNNKKVEMALFILTTIILSGLSITTYFTPNDYLKKKFMFTIPIIYSICLIIISFLFSIYIHTIVIVISLSLIVLDALSMGIYVLLVYWYRIKYKKIKKPFLFNIYGFLLTPFISNFIIIIILHFSLIKNFYDTLFISIAGLFFIISHFIFSLIFANHYKRKGYIYKSIVISLSVYSSVGFIIKKCYRYIKPTFDQFHGANIKPFLFKIYSILLVEFFLILMIFLIGFHFQWHMFFINHKEIIFISVTIAVYIMLVIFFQQRIIYEFYYIFYIISVIAIIFYGFLLSYILDTNVITCLFTLLFLDILSVEIYILFYQEYNKWGMALSPIIINIIILPFMYFFWIRDYHLSYILFIVAFSLILINILIHTLLFAYLTFDYNNKTTLTIVIIKLSLLVFLYSILFYCTDIQRFDINNRDEERLGNDNYKKKRYLLKVNIHLLIYIIIYIILFYVYRANEVVKYAQELNPYLYLYILLTGTITIYVWKVMYKYDKYEREEKGYVFAILNLIYIFPNLYLMIYIYNIYESIYVLWIIFFFLLNMIIYASFCIKFSFFLLLFYPSLTFLIVDYIIYYFFLTNKDWNIPIIIASIVILLYMIIIEIIILFKHNYDQIFYTVLVINYFKYSIHGFFVLITLSLYYYLFCRCFCSESCQEKIEGFLCACREY